MATLALSVAGAAVGSALLPAGVTLLGATISGAVIGSQIGAIAGRFIDQALFGAAGTPRSSNGPRLSDLKVTTSTEGAAVPRIYGRVRLGGQVIWATEIEEEAVTTEAGGNGKGLPTGGNATRTDYRYYANFAVAVCEGEITSIGRVWADGKEIDLSAFTWRLHVGSDSQLPDSLIVAKLGAGDAPAYRGTAYIVFERMPLAEFGNRIPQLSFEVHRSVDPFERSVRATVLIPGSGEFVYATSPVTRATGAASTEAENKHSLQGGTDWQVSLDQLASAMPNAKSTSLVVSWFGNDLRANQCSIRPAVDTAEKDTSPISWGVAGLTRETAAVVSLAGARPAYGGTPSDQTVVAAIRDLKTRGHQVVLTPFILMDIPSDNTLPDPYAIGGAQPPYPWRGRITVSPAPGLVGTPDKTPAAAAAIAAFVGSATPAHFALAGETVVYSGPAEWSLRRMVLHYAKLAVAAGGVDGFVIGTEMRGLTQMRSAPSSYPFVDALVALAADVRAILGPGTRITYAADWSEYFGHQPADGTGDVHFNLDPLWSSSDIDAIAIDCYWPLSDWRDGTDHLDAEAGVRAIYDLDYLKSNLFGGEGFDWYYASPADRDAQVRTEITDGFGKPWVFRYKDLKSWWSNPHFNRPGGAEVSTPTAWVPQSKPIWLTELGAPAVDKGSNQPNVFFDPKSSESFLPFYSRGNRDDLIQRRYLQAFHEAFDPDHSGYVDGANPISTVYDDRMISLDHMHVYAWDARPFPAFPSNRLAWGDHENWLLGHWLNGRIASQPLASVIARLLEDYAFSDYDVSELSGIVAGLAVDRVMSAREALEPLELAHFFDSIESGDTIRFRQRGAAIAGPTLSEDDLVESKPGAALVRLIRTQETELPASARIAYSSLERDYRQAVAQSRRLAGASGRQSLAELALSMTAEDASRTADSWLFEAWASRERAQFSMPPSRLALEPGDVVSLDRQGRESTFRLIEIGDHGARTVEARSVDRSIYAGGAGVGRMPEIGPEVQVGPAVGVFLDLPILTGEQSPDAGFVAAAKRPWPGGVAFYRSPSDSDFRLAALCRRQATVGRLISALSPGPEGRYDYAGQVTVRLDSGALYSTTPASLLAGANAAAIQAANGEWEVIQFLSATLIAPETYRLSTLLRAQVGTDHAMDGGASIDARFVLLDGALTAVDMDRDEVGLIYNWRHGPANRDIGDTSFVETSHAFSGVGRRPFSPVHVHGERSDNDLRIEWIRRTRIGGDSWTGTEVPLSEDAERYEVDIMDGATVRRTIVTTEPEASYPVSMQLADFGSPQASVTVRIMQISATHGRGVARQAVV